MSRPCQLRPSSTKRDTVKSLPSQYLLARRTRIESACKMRVVCLRVADLYMSHAPILQKALEIRWHETKFVPIHWGLAYQLLITFPCRPIFSADFQPFPAESYMKHEHPMGRTEVKEAAASHEGKAWRLATAGGDNHVRVSVNSCITPCRVKLRIF